MLTFRRSYHLTDEEWMFQTLNSKTILSLSPCTYLVRSIMQWPCENLTQKRPRFLCPVFPASKISWGGKCCPGLSSGWRRTFPSLGGLVTCTDTTEDWCGKNEIGRICQSQEIVSKASLALCYVGNYNSARWEGRGYLNEVYLHGEKESHFYVTLWTSAFSLLTK